MAKPATSRRMCGLRFNDQSCGHLPSVALWFWGWQSRWISRTSLEPGTLPPEDAQMHTVSTELRCTRTPVSPALNPPRLRTFRLPYNRARYKTLGQKRKHLLKISWGDGIETAGCTSPCDSFWSMPDVLVYFQRNFLFPYFFLFLLNTTLLSPPFWLSVSATAVSSHLCCKQLTKYLLKSV